MSGSSRVVVFGSSGFVGSAVAQALEAQGSEVVRRRAPRLEPVPADQAATVASDEAQLSSLRESMQGCSAVVNCAGNPDASLDHEPALNAANGALPGLLAAAAAALEPQPRFVHVSSAVVQGRSPRLDDAPAVEGFSAYARSKVLGERLALGLGPAQTVVYRPPSVHAPDRRVTQLTSRIARSPLALVARPGTQPTPQALLENVASAVAFLATTPHTPPRIVAHPSEGLTASGLMEALGGRRPRRVPRLIARLGAGTLTQAGRLLPRLAANARRVELVLFGQEQAPSWLPTAGWQPPRGPDAWTALGALMATDHADEGPTR
jgi:nucleoside-diphosphate-sugar epimerase